MVCGTAPKPGADGTRDPESEQDECEQHQQVGSRRAAHAVPEEQREPDPDDDRDRMGRLREACRDSVARPAGADDRADLLAVGEPDVRRRHAGRREA